MKFELKSNVEVKRIVDKIFNKIEKSISIDELKIIRNELDVYVPSKNRMNITEYPKIEYSITPDEIKELKKIGLIDVENKFSKNISKKINDPITKILYAVAWKNGDLIKLRHIIQGILDTENDNDYNRAFVFHQFGKYLTKNEFEPIVDQHVLRAFAIYQTKDENDIKNIRLLDEINNKNKHLISDYKNWLESDKLKEIRKFHYYIDIILFEIGKTIKKKK